MFFPDILFGIVMLFISSLETIALASTSVHNINKIADNGHPCFTPLRILKRSVKYPFIFIQANGLLYIVLIYFINLSLKPNFLRTSSRKFHSRESNFNYNTTKTQPDTWGGFVLSHTFKCSYNFKYRCAVRSIINGSSLYIL